MQVQRAVGKTLYHEADVQGKGWMAGGGGLLKPRGVWGWGKVFFCKGLLYW